MAMTHEDWNGTWMLVQHSIAGTVSEGIDEDGMKLPSSCTFCILAVT